MNNITSDPILWLIIALITLSVEVWRLSNQIKQLNEHNTVNTISLYLLVKKLDEKDIIKENELIITNNQQENEGV